MHTGTETVLGDTELELRTGAAVTTRWLRSDQTVPFTVREIRGDRIHVSSSREVTFRGANIWEPRTDFDFETSFVVRTPTEDYEVSYEFTHLK